MPDQETYLEQLLLSVPLRDAVMRSAIQALGLPMGSRGLDAGCGAGSNTLLLAEAIGAEGHVTGLDLSVEFLAHARGLAEQAGLTGRVVFREGSVDRLPLDDDAFDWALSVDCVGYPVGEKLAPFRELVRVVRPGGTVALLGWTSQMLLPGHPVFEARLNATASAFLQAQAGKLPNTHFMRTSGRFRELGLAELTGHTEIGEVHAPLGEAIRRALISTFGMLWGEFQHRMTSEDRAEYTRLCDPESPDFILDVPGYYAFITYSMFHGKVV